MNIDVSNLNKLHFSLKSFLIGMLFIMPFFYMDIYLFAPSFFEDAPIAIPIVVSFCMSTLFYSGMFLVTQLAYVVMFRNDNDFNEWGGAISLLALFSCTILGLVTFSGVMKKFNFIDFCSVTCFSLAFSIVFYILLERFITKKRRKLIDRANAILEEGEKINKKSKELMERLDALEAKADKIEKKGEE